MYQTPYSDRSRNDYDDRDWVDDFGSDTCNSPRDDYERRGGGGYSRGRGGEDRYELGRYKSWEGRGREGRYERGGCEGYGYDQDGRYEYNRAGCHHQEGESRYECNGVGVFDHHGDRERGVESHNDHHQGGGRSYDRQGGGSRINRFGGNLGPFGETMERSSSQRSLYDEPPEDKQTQDSLLLSNPSPPRYGSRQLKPPPPPSFEKSIPEAKQAAFFNTSHVAIIEIMPGVRARLRGANETWAAIEKDFYTPCECFGCQETIFCILDAEYVVCPKCQVVSPLEGNFGGGGVGLGFTMEDLARWQEDILSGRL